LQELLNHNALRQRAPVEETVAEITIFLAHRKCRLFLHHPIDWILL